MSLATPHAGLAVTPELPSDPPQLSPRMISLAGTLSRRTLFTWGSNSAIWSMPFGYIENWQTANRRLCKARISPRL